MVVAAAGGPPYRRGMGPVFTLGDGRLLEHVEYGDPAGLPVLYVPGMPGTARVAELCDADARAAGVRVVAVSRPGYGRTTWRPPGLAGFARDCLQLVDHLRLEVVATHGTSGGGPAALALAAVAPDRVAAVLLAAAIGPMRAVVPDALSGADHEALRLVREGRVEAAVELCTEECRRGLEHVVAADTDDELLQRMREGLPPGEGAGTLVTDPARRAVFGADLRRALATYDGLVWDNLSALDEWDVDLHEVRAPVLLHYGARDQMVTMAHAEWLAERLPSSELFVHRDADHGQVCYDHLPEQYARLREAVGDR